MFPEVLTFILNCMSQVVEVLKKFILVDNFNYFDLLVCFAVLVLVFRLVNSIRADVSEEQAWLRNKKREEEYSEYQKKLKQYEKERKGDN